MNEIALCDFEGGSFLIFGPSVPSLIYYSHIPIMLMALALGIFIFSRGWNKLENRIFFFTIISFVFWVFLDSVFWANNRSDIIMAAWAVIILIEPLVYIGCFYLLYVLITKIDVSFLTKVFWSLLYLPLIILTPTNLFLSSFDLTSCLATETPFAYYSYVVEGIALLGIIIFATKHYFRATSTAAKGRILYISLGTFLMLLFFSWGNITGSFTDNWELGQYGLFGMPFFLAAFSYTIVRYRIFEIKLIGSQALVSIVWFVLFSLLFIDQIPFRVKLILLGNLVLYSFLGLMLIRSIKQTYKQKEEIEKLAQNLQKANEQLKILDKMKSEFVSIASHQLRSPLTAIRGYTSMLLEGSFGKLNAKATEAIERISDSSRFMALSVEDYLNVSRIEAGNMRYEMSDFNLKTETEHIVDELRPTALKKGLLLTFKSDCESGAFIHADIGKTRQVLQNLIDNSIKYTLRGTITVKIHDDIKKKRIYATISDTGVGMSKQTQEDVFEKFVRAKNANHVNVTGTGLGLFVAKKMVEEMGGKIKATSEGEGKGSSFIVEWKLVGNSVRGA